MNREKATRWMKSFIVKAIREEFKVDGKRAEKTADKAIGEADLVGGVIPLLKRDLNKAGIQL